MAPSFVGFWLSSLNIVPQGVVRMKSKERLTGMKKIQTEIHWEKCRSFKNSVRYCTDPEKRKDEGRLWSKGVLLPPTLPYQKHNPIQLEMNETIARAESDKVGVRRKVIWWYDEVGNSGKTAWAKYQVMTREDCLVVGGKASDMHFGVAQWLSKQKPLGLVIVNLTRAVEEFVSYTGIETILDGLFFSSKYESCMCCFDSPVVVVLANFLPDKTKLSDDRWDIHKICKC